MLNHILNNLEKKIKGKTAILCIGNRLRGDDAFGPELARRIRGQISLKVMDAATAPENFLGSIIKEKPETVIFIDTVDFKAAPGEMNLWDLERVRPENLFFTHNTSPNLLFDFLKGSLEAKFYLLAVQPKNIGLEEKMSEQVNCCLENLVDWFKEYYPL